jgi:hypothetical protein
MDVVKKILTGIGVAAIIEFSIEPPKIVPSDLANETLNMLIFLCEPPATAPLVKVHDPLKDKISKWP